MERRGLGLNMKVVITIKPNGRDFFRHLFKDGVEMDEVENKENAQAILLTLLNFKEVRDGNSTEVKGLQETKS